jgi:hypothetical protein
MTTLKTTAVLAALPLLLGIGWHCLAEGTAKAPKDPKPASTPQSGSVNIIRDQGNGQGQSVIVERSSATGKTTMITSQGGSVEVRSFKGLPPLPHPVPPPVMPITPQLPSMPPLPLAMPAPRLAPVVPPVVPPVFPLPAPPQGGSVSVISSTDQGKTESVIVTQQPGQPPVVVRSADPKTAVEVLEQPGVAFPQPPIYQGKDNPFWSLKLYVKKLDTELYFCPKTWFWFQYDEKADCFRPFSFLFPAVQG